MGKVAGIAKNYDAELATLRDRNRSLITSLNSSLDQSFTHIENIQATQPYYSFTQSPARKNLQAFDIQDVSKSSGRRRAHLLEKEEPLPPNVPQMADVESSVDRMGAQLASSRIAELPESYFDKLRSFRDDYARECLADLNRPSRKVPDYKDAIAKNEVGYRLGRLEAQDTDESLLTQRAAYFLDDRGFPQPQVGSNVEGYVPRQRHAGNLFTEQELAIIRDATNSSEGYIRVSVPVNKAEDELLEQAMKRNEKPFNPAASMGLESHMHGSAKIVPMKIRPAKNRPIGLNPILHENLPLYGSDSNETKRLLDYNYSHDAGLQRLRQDYQHRSQPRS
eukprot:Clim_evm36s153 gene=Clim_evmTU36s153